MVAGQKRSKSEQAMNTVNASESVQAHVQWSWNAPEEADERASAVEAVDALLALADGWLENAALEIRLGTFDRERFTEAPMSLLDSYHLLCADVSSGVRIAPRTA
jgi:hypothetical protein